MNTIVFLVQIGGAVQLAIVLANGVLPRRLALGDQLPRLSRILAQALLVHWAYILLVLVVFGILCLAFAPDLAGGGPLGRFLSVCLALFWTLRLGLQLFYYDRSFLRANRLGSAAMTLASGYLAGVFILCSIGRIG